ncbi:MAG: recombination protein RecR [Omnitrophica bacterium RIFCSPLOWO2_12_FULL_44_17]|uniref:Recombination protein RecR n=1 Tax=Candidatus Danuiimicrobium aquiferis TaxID=1801832 RepID=A0A1G1L1C8_9BACT|nr:MAG: recombination protein RecR [Omnitrophica bacterium RIFCSPHIGHO2_02_FULL_45_28]OGW98957.1 MAG: recombination protein RecR [Omnitrophica bacterium RIFCSPLOWO2_12_FULL_44_17]OGX04594.1 MAG: recombination protein RecR [Omnitrophica bacterium RIFCSPLOWO2_02_FULL_44_11]
MSKGYSERLAKLIKQLSKLPGIGPKSAERIVLHMMKQEAHEVEELSKALVDAKTNTFFCEECGNLSENKLCHICADTTRDHSLICVVEQPKDVIAIEKTSGFNGIYHVLLGALSPIDGIGPRELRIEKLIKRVSGGKVEEIILATNPNAEGEATALYITEILKTKTIKITRIARGVPIGSNIEYVDQATLQRAMEARTAM